MVTHASTVANIRRGREMTVASLQARNRMAEMEAYGFLMLSEGTETIGLPGTPGSEEEEHPFLQSEEEVEVIEESVLLEASVESSRRYRAAKEEDDPAGASLSTYIANLYFELEEGETDVGY